MGNISLFYVSITIFRSGMVYEGMKTHLKIYALVMKTAWRRRELIKCSITKE
jgi:hypothetical protein